MIYLVRIKLEQLNEKHHIKVPMDNIIGLACTQNCLALFGFLASTMLHGIIQMCSVWSTASLRRKKAFTEHLIAGRSASARDPEQFTGHQYCTS